MTVTLVYQTRQIREFERFAAEKYQLTGELLMQRAGRAAFDFLQSRWPGAKKILVVCGSGNNGGDGYMLAHFARESGCEVIVWQLGEARSQQQNIPFQSFSAHQSFPQVDVIVDAICGIGLQSGVRNETALAIKKMQAANLPLLSLDVPTGINADTGKVCGTALRASATITFIGHKLGLLTGEGIAHTGELYCDNLQLPEALFAAIPPVAGIMDEQVKNEWLKPRARDWHKGKSGHVLVIGGEAGFAGAPRMAAEAALRVGAGLVSVATRPEQASGMTMGRPEIMCHGASTSADLEVLLSRATVIVLGPGLGQTAWSREMWSCLAQQDLPTVIDADGLNLLAQSPMHRDNWILTPHPGEAARLLGLSVNGVQENRLTASEAIQQRYGGVCVLKGAGSLITSEKMLPAICIKGNPGMASAGMGDVLSGVIGGLLAQGLPLEIAARVGVELHAAAGDLAAREGQRGLLATDLMLPLRKLVNPVS